MAPELKTEASKVRGCASQVWLVSEPRSGAPGGARRRCIFEGDSDAHIVRGLIAILFAIYDGKPRRGDPGDRSRSAVFDELGPQGAPDAAALERPRLDGRAHPRRRPRRGCSCLMISLARRRFVGSITIRCSGPLA